MTQRILQAVAQFLVTFIATWALMVWLGGEHHLLHVWPLTAIQLAIVLASWSNPVSCIPQIVAGAFGEMIALDLVGVPLWIGLALSINQAFEADSGCIVAKFGNNSEVMSS